MQMIATHVSSYNVKLSLLILENMSNFVPEIIYACEIFGCKVVKFTRFEVRIYSSAKKDSKI